MYTLIGILTHLSEKLFAKCWEKLNCNCTIDVFYRYDVKKLEEKAQGIAEISASAQNIFEHVNKVSTNSQEHQPCNALYERE